MNHDDPFFSSVEIKKLNIEGEIIELPIRYFESKAIVVSFLAPLKKVKEVLPTERLRPIEIFPNWSAVTFIAFQQIATSLGPFNEFDIAIPVFLDANFLPPLIPALNYKKYKNFGIYMHQIFVSNKSALVAGTGVWGYPKILADILWWEDATGCYMEVTKDKERIIKLSAKKIDRKKNYFFNTFYTYSVKDNEILKTPVDWRGERYFGRFSNSISFEVGRHPLSVHIRRFCLKNFFVEGSRYTSLQYILNLPKESFPVN